MTTPTQTYTPNMFTAPTHVIHTIDTMPPPPLPERLLAPVIPDFVSLGGSITSSTIDMTGATSTYGAGLAQPPTYLNDVTVRVNFRIFLQLKIVDAKFKFIFVLDRAIGEATGVQG